jgi:hypothetical protein
MLRTQSLEFSRLLHGHVVKKSLNRLELSQKIQRLVRERTGFILPKNFLIFSLGLISVDTEAVCDMIWHESSEYRFAPWEATDLIELLSQALAAQAFGEDYGKMDQLPK